MKKITLTRPTVYESQGVRLMPGDNVVTADQLAALMRNKIVVQDINLGILRVGHGEAPSPAFEVAPDDDIDALKALAAGDGRRADVKEARRRLAELGHAN